MKTLIISIAFVLACNIASAQTTKGTNQKKDKVHHPGKTHPTQNPVEKDKPAKKQDPNHRRDAEGPEAPYSKEPKTPKDQSGKDSNKIGDSPKR